MEDLQKLIREKIRNEFLGFDYTYKRFSADKRKQRHYQNEKKFINSVLAKEVKIQADFLQLIIDKNQQLAMALDHYLMPSGKKSRSSSVHNDIPQLKDYLLIQIIIANNYQAMKDCLLQGLNYQSTVLFRNTMELTELAVGILGDEELYRFYRRTVKDGDGIEKFQSIKYERIKSKVNSILKWVKNLGKSDFPVNIWNAYLAIRDDMYGHSSKHVHTNFESIYLESYVEPLDNRYWDVKGFVMPNIGGIINKRTESRIKDLIIYESISHIMILMLLIEKHKMPFKYFGKQAGYTVALSKLGWDLVADVLNT